MSIAWCKNLSFVKSCPDIVAYFSLKFTTMKGKPNPNTLIKSIKPGSKPSATGMNKSKKGNCGCK